MKILIVHDAECGSPDENDTIDQVNFVVDSLVDIAVLKVYRVDRSNLDGLTETVVSFCPDVVFNLAENRLIHAVPLLLDELKVPYTGNSAAVLLLTTDKLLFKKMMPKSMTPPFITENRGRIRKGHAYIIKSVNGDASVGIDDDAVFYPRDTADARCRLQMRKVPSFAEMFIDGREFSIAVLPDKTGNCEFFPPREVCFHDFPADKPKILGYKAKWAEDSFEYQNTLTKTNGLKNEPDLLRLMMRCVDTVRKRFALRGYARIDFRVSPQGVPYVLEVNANPCISPFGSGFYNSFTEKGYKGSDLVKRIVDAV